MKYYCLLILFFVFHFSFSQNEILQESINYFLQGNQDEAVNTEDIAEQLRIYLIHPININSVDFESLSKFPLINAEQAKMIIDYRASNGKFTNIYELKHLQFNLEFIQLLVPFFKVDHPPSPKSDALFIFRMQGTIEKQKGYADSLSNGYRGTSNKVYSRFKYSSDNISFGFTAEKDPGESFYNKYQPNGFDFYNGFVQFKNKKSQFIIGDFTVNTAQGLVLSNGYRNAFTASPLYANLFQNQSRPYTSSDENSFFRGLCYRKKTGKIILQPFLSYKKIDASINNGNITTLLNTGYHRTLSELSKKDNATEISVGSSTLYQNKNWSIGLNNLAYQYNLPYVPDSSYYKPTFPQSGWQYINSIDYSIDHKNFNFFGEMATSRQFKFAVINGIIISFNEQLSTSVRMRYYDPYFVNPYANSYSQGSGVKNESGIDFNILWNMSYNKQLSLSYDVFAHPWMRYGITQPTQGKEFSALYQVTVNDALNFYFRYQHQISDQQFQKIRAHLNWNYSFRATLSVRGETNIANGTYSWLSYINVAHQIKNMPFKIHFRYSLFNISDYASRIYTYENDMLYSSSIPFFDGAGNRIYGMINYSLNRDLSLSFRVSTSLYNNKNSIGSDKDFINGNHKSEAKLQLLWRN